MSSANTTEFCRRLKEARDKRNLSQTELAERAGLQPAAINHFESGRRMPSFENLRKLADALQVTVDYLLGRSSPVEMFRERRDNLSAESQSILDGFIKMLEDKDKAKKNNGTK